MDNTGIKFLACVVIIPLGLYLVVTGIKGIAKGTIQPYLHWNDPKVIYRTERPALFWIFVVFCLLLGLLAIANAIMLILGWYQ
jgi:hypothetical protein